MKRSPAHCNQDCNQPPFSPEITQAEGEIVAIGLLESLSPKPDVTVWYDRGRERRRACRACGTAFVPSRKDAICCSETCGARLRKRAQRAREAEPTFTIRLANPDAFTDVGFDCDDVDPIVRWCFEDDRRRFASFAQAKRKGAHLPSRLEES